MRDVELSDAQLVQAVAAAVRVPRVDPADSFVLHAPLELVARAALLPHVAPASRERARRRIVDVAVELDAFGPAVSDAAPPELPSVEVAAARLADAIDRGELDDVDAAAHWLGTVASGAELRDLLAATMVPRLSAAAHGSIFLYQLPRIAPRREITAQLLRPLARELARQPDWRIHWIDGLDRPPTASAPDAATDRPPSMFEALAATPRGAPPASTFIHPLMSRVDHSGLAEAQLAPTVAAARDPGTRRRAGHEIMRAAAWSMVLEPDDHAAYGWSHCLTLPQAVLGIADASGDPAAALAVAATYVVGFRSALAREPLRTDLEPDDPGIPMAEALDAGPVTASAAAWHLDANAQAALIGELVTRASVQRDAHLVKYTLASLDAAADDPTHRRLYLAAASSLVAWWSERGDAAHAA